MARSPFRGLEPGRLRSRHTSSAATHRSEGSAFCTLQHAASFRRIDHLHAATCRVLPKDRPSALCSMPRPSEGSTFCPLQHAASFRRIDLLHAATCRVIPKDRPHARCNKPHRSEGSTSCTLQHAEVFRIIELLQGAEAASFRTIDLLHAARPPIFRTIDLLHAARAVIFGMTDLLHAAGSPIFRITGLLRVARGRNFGRSRHLRTAPTSFIPNDRPSARCAKGLPSERIAVGARPVLRSKERQAYALRGLVALAGISPDWRPFSRRRPWGPRFRGWASPALRASGSSLWPARAAPETR
jgi:hypothetical protein